MHSHGFVAAGYGIDYDAHMGISFAKAPLVEIIVELRWIPQGITPSEGGGQPLIIPPISGGAGKQEDFYSRVARALYGHGFDRSERLLPAALGPLVNQPVLRLRSEREDRTSVLYQVGCGIFSIHGVPPYHSWSKFLPFVKAGNEALLESRLDVERIQPFSQVALRYIDFFGEEFVRGRDVPSFINDIFGISASFPEAITRPATSRQPKSLLTKITLPVEGGELTLTVGDGKFGNQAGILLDTQVSSLGEVAPAVDVIMAALDSGHDVIHKMFLELTRPIHDLMQPAGDK